MVERMSHMIEGDKDYSGIRLTLDLAGYDLDNRELVTAAIKQARQVLRDRRFLNCALGRLTTVMYSNESIGEWLDHMPKSTVQAMASGRIPERYSAKQRDGLKALVTHILSECRIVLDTLG